MITISHSAPLPWTEEAGPLSQKEDTRRKCVQSLYRERLYNWDMARSQSGATAGHEADPSHSWMKFEGS